MAAFCTIVTADHLPFARVVFQSIATHEKGHHTYHVLIPEPHEKIDDPKIQFVDYADLDIGKAADTLDILKKTDFSSKFRWMLKPFIVRHLLATHDLVYWVDPDLFFYNDLTYSHQLLENHSFIISPQWHSFDPIVSSLDFPRNFYHAAFNGGFFGVRKEAITIMEKWIEWMCYKLEVNRKLGLYVDQSYLSLFHLIDDQGAIIRHKGYNLASWNRRECNRMIQGKQVLINGKDKVVFIHFTHDTIKYILNGEDKLLRSHLNIYLTEILDIMPDIKILKRHKVSKIKHVLSTN